MWNKDRGRVGEERKMPCGNTAGHSSMPRFSRTAVELDREPSLAKSVPAHDRRFTETYLSTPA